MDQDVRDFYNRLFGIISKIQFHSFDDWDPEEMPTLKELQVQNYGTQTELVFNILLVKFGARPSTFSNIVDHLLVHNRDFMNFITDDPNLVIETFYTEGLSEGLLGDLVIYNQKFAHLFVERDIRGADRKYVHYLRGARLGLPCPDDFFSMYSKDTTRVDMFLISDEISIPFYYFFCKYNNRDGAHTGLDQWFTFQRFALLVGKKIDMKMTLSNMFSAS